MRRYSPRSCCCCTRLLFDESQFSDLRVPTCKMLRQPATHACLGVMTPLQANPFTWVVEQPALLLSNTCHTSNPQWLPIACGSCAWAGPRDGGGGSGRNIQQRCCRVHHSDCDPQARVGSGSLPAVRSISSCFRRNWIIEYHCKRVGPYSAGLKS